MDRQVILNDLSTYWDELRGHRVAPRRSDLNPNRFGAALEHMFILETSQDGPLRIRLAGTRLCDMMGMEPRGMPARAIFLLADQQHADNLLNEVVRNPALIDITLNATSESGAVYEGGMMLRPLCDDFGTVTRVLGCIVMDAPQFEVNLDIGISSASVDTLGEPARSMEPAGFAEEQTPFEGPHIRSVPQTGTVTRPTRQPLSRDHLRIVSSRS